MDSPPRLSGLKGKLEIRYPQERNLASSSTSTTLHDYSPLLEDRSEIRLLELLPGSFSSEIRICLFNKCLTKDSIPDFEALSYAWGSLDDPVNIFIGQSGNNILAITQNLAAALRYLRYENESRIIWIDAICVNQNDLKERSKQVKRMADIFSNARIVLVWLGCETHDSSLALECLKKVSSKVKIDWRSSKTQALSDELHWTDMSQTLPFDDTQIIAITSLLNRAWFKRLWVWQEVHLAKEVIVMCGTESITWMAICTFALFSWYKNMPALFYDHIPESHRMLLCGLCQSIDQLFFFELINSMKYSLCSDPRDRVFALFSLITGSEKYLKTEPDYTKSATEVFKDTVVRSIEGSRSLQILLSAELPDFPEKMPSWVPNWALPIKTVPMQNVFAQNYSEASFKFKGNDVLQITGVTGLTIALVEPFTWSDSEVINYDKIAVELQRVAKELKLHYCIDKKPQQLRELCQALCSNTFSDIKQTALNSPTVLQGEDFLQRILLSQTEGNVNDFTSFSALDDRYMNNAVFYSSNRSLFISTDGHIGLAPKNARPRDLVVALLGCQSPIVLRPTSQNKYLIVGEAFYSGLADGAAFLGPLPESFRLLDRYSERRKVTYWAFMNRDSGEVQIDHPNLVNVPLPSGWRKEEHQEQELWNWYVNDETGEEKDFVDPRLSPEELTSRGVELQEFDII